MHESDESRAPDGSHITAIKDRDGVEHKYRLERYHGAMKGFAYGPKALYVVAEPMGHVADSVGYINGVDMAGVGRSISLMANRLAEVGGPEFLREGMLHVLRSRPPRPGDELVTAGDGLVWERVHDRFDDIYGGNYIELLRAAYWWIVVEYDPFGSGALDEFRESWTQLRHALTNALTGEVERIFGDDSQKSTGSPST